MEEPSVEQLTRRLQKALRLVEKLKSKTHFEKEVSKELAKRNDALQAEVDKEREQYAALSVAFTDLYEEYADSLKDQEALLEDKNLTLYLPNFVQSPTALEDFRSALYSKRQIMAAIRLRSGIEKKRSTNRRRGSDIGLSLMDFNSTSLLRHSITDSATSPFQKLKKNAVAIPEAPVSAPPSPTARAAATAPLFEHFLVIGVPVECAKDFAETMRQQSSMSNRIMKKLSTMLSVKRSNSTDLTEKTATPRTAREDIGLPSIAVDTPSPATGAKSGLLSSFMSRFKESSQSLPSTPTAPTDNATPAAALFPAVEAPTNQIDPDQIQVKTYEPTILYRYPPDAEPPASEICDFCLPSGGKLTHIRPRDADTVVMEILYGHGQSKRSGRCFIFILEDKTLDIDTFADDETGEGTGRLYGICVVHPRLLHAQPSGMLDSDVSFDFEASVAYCFLTRFPLFDFFFKAIWGIMSYERIIRMQSMLNHTEKNYDRRSYEYLPLTLLREVLGQMSAVKVPRYGDVLHVEFSANVIEHIREAPPDDLPEHINNAVDWCLPPLLSWIKPEIIVRVLSLLLCEAKVFIIGAEAGMVSGSVIGLTSLLLPFQWSAPMIPILPLRHLDFLDSPVPLLAGIVVDEEAAATELSYDACYESISPQYILNRCSDGGILTAVLDLNTRDVYMLRQDYKILPEVLIPRAPSLMETLNELQLNVSSRHSVGVVSDEKLRKPNYVITERQRTKCKKAQAALYAHLEGLIANAQRTYATMMKERMLAVEAKVKANLVILEQMSHTEETVTVESNTPFGLESVEEAVESIISRDDLESMVEHALSSEHDEVTATADSLTVEPPVTTLDFEEDMILGNIFILSDDDLVSKFDEEQFLRRFVNTQMYSQFQSENNMHVSDVEAEAYDELLQETSISRNAPIRHRSQSVAVESPRQVPFAKRPSSLTVKRSNSSRSVLSPRQEESERKSGSKDANGRMPHRHSAPDIKDGMSAKYEKKHEDTRDAVMVADRKDSKNWEL